jgi:nuclear pore complex protein Nup188
MRSIAAVISLSILGVGSCLEYLNDPGADVVVSSGDPSGDPYILNTRTITEIHTILMDAAASASPTSGPAVLAWVSILQVMRSRISDNETARQRLMDGFDDEYNRFDRRSSSDTELTLAHDVYQVVIDDIMDSTQEDPIEYLGLSAVNESHVFETLSGLSLRLGDTSTAYFSNVVGARMRIIILDLLRSSTTIGYIPEIVEAAISTLTGGQNYWDLADSRQLSKEDDPLATFLEDEELVNAFLQAARLRYPYESLPFLKMVRAVAACSTCFGEDGSKTAVRFLETVPTFTYQLRDGFVSYETTQEEDNNNNIRLTAPVQLFERRSKRRGFQDRSSALARPDTDFCIPAGTNGRIINESGPKVVFWFHEYSGMKYLGKLLETFLTAADEVDATMGEITNRDSVAEIIEIFATVLLSISRSPEITANKKDFIGQVLEGASSGLSRNRDIITVVFDIFEEELQKQPGPLGSEVPLEVLINCVHLIHALMLVSPGRVWPLLGRSGLLGIVGGGGRLLSIVEGVELVSGRYDLLLSCSRLFESLVDDFVTNAITRRRGKKSARFDDGEERGTGIPDHVLSKVVLSFTRYLVEVLESSCTWKFVEQDDRRLLSKTITKSFDKILHYAYGIEAISEGTSKLMSPLVPAASHIVDSFLSTSSGTLRFQPFLHAFYEGLETPGLTTFLNGLKLWTTQVRVVLSFSETVLRVGILLERPFSQLENQLFKASPLIARLYAVNDSYRIKVGALFEALIVSAAKNASEPPSLLGHLGPQSAKNFIQMLSDLDKPLSRDQNIISIWHLMSMVVSNRQQWFANYLLTGKTPKDALKKTSGKELGALDKPLLNTALDALSNITEISKTKALAMLEFVALAQNFWPWTVYESEKHSDFIKAISEFVGTLQPDQPVQPAATLDAAIDACYQTRIAAYVAEILAMHLFHSRQTRNSSALKALIPNLSYYARFAVAVPHYNTSLHEYLRRNYEARYPGCSPRDLKRTTLEHRQYGRDYFYDLSLADKMLSRDQAWTGRKDDGLKTEFANANVNLSLLDAQIVSDRLAGFLNSS